MILDDIKKANMVALKDAKELFATCKKIFEVVRG